MDPPPTLVWLAPESPDSEQSRALATWARAHGVKLAAPAKAFASTMTVDGRVADDVETLLEHARDAIGARKAGEADQALSAAESALRAHPELPQAAWLMAEVQRVQATRLRRIPPADEEGAERMWLRAEALDGGRISGIGEQGSDQHPEPATVALELSSDDIQLWLDCARVPADPAGPPAPSPHRGPGKIETRAGLHALVATNGAGAPVWAEWIETPAGTSAVRVSALGAPKCSADDVAHAHLAPAGIGSPSSHAIDARHVRCDAWVAADAGTQPGSVRIATCAADRCGPSFEWRTPPAWTWSATVEHGNDARWPAWGTWGLVGAGVAVATGVAVVVFGALQSGPHETRFVNGGIKSQ